MLALKHHEEPWLGATPRSFELLILAKGVGEDIGQRQGAIPLALAGDADLFIAEHDVSETELQYLP
jgi:hypothetical protein